MLHIPKGGMCRTCAYWPGDCSRLPFSSMPVIERRGDIVVVRCTHYHRARNDAELTYAEHARAIKKRQKECAL